MRLSTQRKQEIVRAYVLATGGVLPRDLGQLLRAMREIIPDVSESEVRIVLTTARTLRRVERFCPSAA